VQCVSIHFGEIKLPNRRIWQYNLSFVHKEKCPNFWVKNHSPEPWQRCIMSEQTRFRDVNSFKSAVRPAYLRRLRDTAHELCSAQPRPSTRNAVNLRASRYRAQKSQAAYRRAYVLSLFSICMSEATKEKGLQELQDAHSKAKLPFMDLEREANNAYPYDPASMEFPACIMA
jgi:hypothetical protein